MFGNPNSKVVSCILIYSSPARVKLLFKTQCPGIILMLITRRHNDSFVCIFASAVEINACAIDCVYNCARVWVNVSLEWGVGGVPRCCTTQLITYARVQLCSQGGRR